MLIEHAQRLFFVQKDGRTLSAHWVDYSLDDTRRTKLTVHRLTRLLIPRTGLALGVADEVYDVALADVEGWLEAHGYRITSHIDEARG